MKTAERLLYVLACLPLLFLGSVLWNFTTVFPFANFISIIVIGCGLVLSVGFGSAQNPRWLSIFRGCYLILFGIALMSWTYGYAHSLAGYGTDEIAFDQYAALQFLHGINPYTISMAPSLQLYHVPGIYHTYTLTGKSVFQLSYPDLSFLLYLPALWLGLTSTGALWTDMVMWFFTILLLYRILPPLYKPIALWIGCFPLFLSFGLGGVTSVLFMPFLILSFYQFDLQAKKGLWLSPIMMGLAVSIKQTVWFVAPFILIAIYKETKSFKAVLKYFLISGGTFLLVNAYFIVNSPKAWFKGIFAPFLQHLVPSGQGLVNLLMFEHIGSHISYLTVGSIFLLLSFLVLLYIFYEYLKPVLVLLPSLVLFFPSRSFMSYLVNLFPVLLVGFASVEHFSDFQSISAKQKRFALLSVVPSVLFFLLALCLPAPLQLRILSVRSTGSLQSIDQIQVQVTNRSHHSVHPYYSLSLAPQLSGFWTVEKGLRILPPNSTHVVTLDSPGVHSMPSITGSFYVNAFTQTPSTVSVSNPYKVSFLATDITPNVFSNPVSVGNTIHLTVQLYGRGMKPLHRSGVPIILTQIIYEQNGFGTSPARINGHKIGINVHAITNNKGQALFSIVGEKASNLPSYFQSYVSTPNHYPYGYSSMVAIHFKK